MEERPAIGIPLSAAQLEIWLAQSLQPGSTIYTVAQSLTLPPELDVEAFERALAVTIAESECLHVRFQDTPDGPSQRLAIVPEWSLSQVDLSGSPATLEEAIEAVLAEPFELGAPALFRFALIRSLDGDWTFVQAFHHIVIDGQGCAAFAARVSEIYAALRGGDVLPDRRFGSFAGLLAADADYRASEAAESDRAFWRKHLHGGNGGAARAITAGSTQAREWVAETVPFERAERWRRATTQAGVRLPHLFGVAAHALAALLDGDDDACIALAVAARVDPRLRDTPGAVANLVAVRADMVWNRTWRETLSAMRVTFDEALAHQRARFEDVRRDLAATGAVIQPSIVVNCIPFYRPLAFDGVASRLRGRKYAAVEDMAVFAYFNSQDDRILLDFVRNPTVRSPADLRRFAARFLRLCDVIADGLDRTAEVADIADGNERAQVAAWSKALALPPAETVPAAFARRAAAHPEAVALAFRERVVSYRDLQDRAQRICDGLRARGVEPERIVAVAMDRSDALIAVLLGVLMAGGAYLVLDIANPEDRLVGVLEDVEAIVLIADASGLDAVEVAARRTNVPVVRIEDLAEPVPARGADAGPSILPDHPAYICYTSGSTGRPKGVVARHRDIVDLAVHRQWSGSAQARVLVHSPVSFDASTYEIWTPLLNGHTCVVAEPGRLDAAAIRAHVLRHKVTALFLTTGLFHLVVDTDLQALAGVREILTGGEVIAPQAVDQAQRGLPGVRVAPCYGPTEATTFVTIHMMTEASEMPVGVPLGRPLDGNSVHVLDLQLRPLPIGMVGELYVGGAGVARGYLHRPDLTAERFVASPFGPPGERLYRTGDRVAWRDDGMLRFEGRIDGQIKLRGYRIEPAEIEAALSALGFARTVVTLHRFSATHASLVAYVVGAEVDAEALKRDLAARLPGYMVPSAIVALDSLPLKANGKIDRGRLPRPRFERRVDAAAPRTDNEALIAELFRETLDLESVDVDDNFFDDLGGSSLLAFRIAGALRQRSGCPLAADAMFKLPTVALLAAHVDALQGRSISAPRSAPAVARHEPIDIAALLAERFHDQPAGSKAFAATIEPDGERRILYAPGGALESEAESATFPLGSISKFLASFLLCQMEQAGRAGLADTLAARFGATLVLPDRLGRGVTLTDLATHTSGLPPLVPELDRADEETVRHYLSSFDTPFTDGTYQYCSFGLALLGLALRAGESGSYLDVLERYVTGPLGMTNTGSLLTASDGFRFYECSRDMRSSIADLQRLMASFLSDEPTVAQASLARMVSVARPTGMPDLDMTVGLRSRRSHGAHLLYHGGGGDGYRAFFGFAPETRRGIVLLTNREIHIGDIGQHWLCSAYPLAAPAAARRKVLARA